MIAISRGLAASLTLHGVFLTYPVCFLFEPCHRMKIFKRIQSLVEGGPVDAPMHPRMSGKKATVYGVLWRRDPLREDLQEAISAVFIQPSTLSKAAR